MKNYLGASLGYILVQIYFYFISSNYTNLSKTEKLGSIFLSFILFSIFYFIFSFLINKFTKK